MTRVLSELLGAKEPMFHLGLAQLERSAGRPNADIRLSTDIRHTMLSKLKELGLDHNDTTAQELYSALRVRLLADEDRFLRTISASTKETAFENDPTAAVAFVLNRELKQSSTFALKNATARKLLKANTPKKVMKLLGYRSPESMLKQETAASLFAAAWFTESEQWIKKLLASYTKLSATDFENRPLAIEYPSSKRWQQFSEKILASKRYNILSFKELGSVVLLPLPEGIRPALPALTTAALTIHAANDVLTASTYLKLQQGQSDFGSLVREVVLHEPVLEDRLLDRPVSWSLLQQYYARLKTTGTQVRTDLFEPFVTAQDLVWHSVEHIVARIEPSLEFWLGTGHLGHVDKGQAVSCNLTDNVLSHCNALPFAERMSSYFRNQLTAELLLGYLDQERLERALTTQNQRQFAAETVTI